MSLYGLKSSGAAWKSQLSHKISYLVIVSSFVNRYVWMRKATKPDIFKYWIFLINTDYIIKNFRESHAIMEVLSKVYGLKSIMRLNRITMSQRGTLMKILSSFISWLQFKFMVYSLGGNKINNLWTQLLLSWMKMVWILMVGPTWWQSMVIS